MKLQHSIIDYGQYKGFMYEKIPDDYLEYLWESDENYFAYEEIKRRRVLPITERLILFGKYKESLWINLDEGYLKWISLNFDETEIYKTLALEALEYKKLKKGTTMKETLNSENKDKILNFSNEEIIESIINNISHMYGNNYWISDNQITFFKNFLKPLVVLRDFNLFIKAEDIKYIEKLEDFKNFDKHDFTLTQLYGYMEYQAIIDLIYTFRKLLQEDEFIEMLRNHPFHKSLWTREKYKQSYLDELALFMQRNGVDVSNEFKKPIYNEYGEDTKKAMKYNIENWNKVIKEYLNNI